MVDDAVDHCCGNDVVGECFAPPPELQVGGDQDRTLLVSRCEELEEQVRGVLIERDLSDFVDDDDQFVAANLFQSASGFPV